MTTEKKRLRARRTGMERFDAILSGSIGRQLLAYAVLIVLFIAVFVLTAYLSCDSLWASKESGHTLLGTLRGVIYHFFDAGNLHNEEDFPAVVLAPVISFFGMVLLSGVLVTTLGNIVERRVENVACGLVTYRGIGDHYVVIGYGEVTNCLIRDIFRRSAATGGGMPKVVVLTSQDVKKVRAQVQSQLADSESESVIIYSGDIESREHIARLNVDRAREVYILGEEEEYGRDSKNLECVRIVRELRGTGRPVLQVNVQFDRPASYSIIQKLPFPDEYVRQDGEQVIYFRPFNFFENWARLLWGYYRKPEYARLDFVPDGEEASGDCPLRSGTERHVHLVIVGFNRMGRALLLEALRICHFPNYDEASGRNKTRVTVVDPRMGELLPQFESQYPYVREITDIEVDYCPCRVEDAAVREMLARSAVDDRELLTVAVCLSDPDMSLSTGLSLPEPLYSRTAGDKVENNGRVRILIRQELQKGIGVILDADNDRYRHIKVFGMLTDGIGHGLLDDTATMWVNAYYDCKYAPAPGSPKRALYDRFADCRGRHGFGPEASILDLADRPGHRGEMAEIARGLWYLTAEDFRFANRYQIEMYDIYRRYGSCESRPTLYRMEHLRWCADRRIIGYRAVPLKRLKSEAFKTHHLLVPYDDLSQAEKDKDADVVENIPRIVALSGNNSNGQEGYGD